MKDGTRWRVGAALALLVLAGGAAAAWAAGVLIPSRKPGMWELRMSTGDSTNEAVMQMCIDEKTDADMMDTSLTLITSLCPRPAWSREQQDILITADCQISPGRKVLSRVRLTGDFQSLYWFKMHTKTGLGADSETDIEHQYTWLGASCTDGLLPGFVRLPNGGRMKLKKMMSLLENMTGR
jgi:hypothetical protein